jgi:putative MATE family efflux protein
MMQARNKLLLEEKIGKLLFKLSAPAMLGMLVSALYNLVDTIFIGQGVGVLGIAGVSVAFPVMMFIMAVALSIGIGGASIISRALGANDKERAEKAMGNIFSMVILISIIMSALGLVFTEPIIRLFGANNEILPFASSYIKIILVGVPFFTFAVAGNHIIRSEGNAKTAMIVMVLSAVLNVILDPIFIFGFHLGIEGAALATILSQLITFLYMVVYFYSPKSLLRFHLKNLKLDLPIIKETLAIGAATFARQVSMSVMTIILNRALNIYSGSLGIAAFGVINRLLIFTMMPMFGIIQGIQPIIGFNYGAKRFKRVTQSLFLSIKITTYMATAAFFILMIFTEPLIKLFSSDADLIAITKPATRIVIMMLPLVGFQVIVAGMYQSVGKAKPALFLSLLRQVILLIPLVLILPIFFQLNGIWLSFPIADSLAILVSYFMFRRELKMLNKKSPG